MSPAVPPKSQPRLLGKIPGRWPSFVKDRLGIGALVLVVLGLIFLLLPGGGLQGVGGIVFGTGLTVLLGTWTNRQQLAKEANLRRKTEVYAPLHAELQYLRERLQAAREGVKPYLQRIDVPGWKPSPSVYPVARNEVPPPLHYWPDFKSDARRFDFSESTRQLLNALLQTAMDYNTAVENAREAAIDILAPAIKTAMTRVAQSAEYRQWHREHVNTDILPGASQQPASKKWFDHIESALSQSSSSPIEQEWAKFWLEGGVISPQPATLGWILAGIRAEAIQCIDVIGNTPGYVYKPTPLEWSQAIIDEAWTALESHPSRHVACLLHEELFKQVVQAEKKVEDKLVYIQETYEGGPPPL